MGYFQSSTRGAQARVMKHSKWVIRDRMGKLRHIAFDDEPMSGYRSDQSTKSTSFKARVINMQALFAQWEDGDPSSPDLEPEGEEPGIDSDNAETDSENELP